MLKHINIEVRGKVQGVFFRDHTRRKAEELGIKGYVKNMEDGSVYIEAEQEEETLEKFLEWCYEGSPRSRVDQVKSETAGFINFSSFKIEK
jgi:acylphosphatase